MVMSVERGLPVILVDAEGLEEHGLVEGEKGECSAHMVFPETNETIIGFHPDKERKIYYASVDRFVVDEEKLKEEGH